MIQATFNYQSDRLYAAIVVAVDRHLHDRRAARKALHPLLKERLARRLKSRAGRRRAAFDRLAESRIRYDGALNRHLLGYSSLCASPLDFRARQWIGRGAKKFPCCLSAFSRGLHLLLRLKWLIGYLWAGARTTAFAGPTLITCQSAVGPRVAVGKDCQMRLERPFLVALEPQPLSLSRDARLKSGDLPNMH